MAENGGAGRVLAGCGCLVWLLAVLVVLLVQVLVRMGVHMPDAFLLTTCSVCCAGVSFVVALVGVVLIALGNARPYSDL